MEHRERCDPRMFLTSTLENNSGKGKRWRHSIWSSTPGIQDGRRSRFPFPVAGRINRRAVLSQKLVTFWRRKREEHFLLAKPWEKSNFKLEKLNRVFDFLYARFNFRCLSRTLTFGIECLKCDGKLGSYPFLPLYSELYIANCPFFANSISLAF